jgi:hypothetical protein
LLATPSFWMMRSMPPSFTLCRFLSSMVQVLSLISNKTKSSCLPPCLPFKCAQDILMIKPSHDASSSTRC